MKEAVHPMSPVAGICSRHRMSLGRVLTVAATFASVAAGPTSAWSTDKFDVRGASTGMTLDQISRAGGMECSFLGDGFALCSEPGGTDQFEVNMGGNEPSSVAFYIDFKFCTVAPITDVVVSAQNAYDIKLKKIEQVGRDDVYKGVLSNGLEMSLKRVPQNLCPNDTERYSLAIGDRHLKRQIMNELEEKLKRENQLPKF